MGERTLKIYQNLVGEHPDIAIKGKKTAYTAVNGNMFSFLDDTGNLCIRLDSDDKAKFQEKHGVGDVIQHNSVMRGYVPVPDIMLEYHDELAALFAQSVKFAKALKPKPTKRKK